MTDQPSYKSTERLTFHYGVDPGVEPVVACVATLNGVYISHAVASVRGLQGLLKTGGVSVAADEVCSAFAEIGRTLHKATAMSMGAHPTSLRQGSVCFAVEDVALSVRPGQTPQSAVKLGVAHTLCVVSAEACLNAMRGLSGVNPGGRTDREVGAPVFELAEPRPQVWRAFYALGLSEKPAKAASVDMAGRVLRDLQDLSVQQVLKGDLDCLIGGGQVQSRADIALLSISDGETRTRFEQLANHNAADAFLMAARDMLILQHGWDFYRPLAAKANVS